MPAPLGGATVAAPLDLAALRRQLMMTQAQFAALLGVHWITVSKWERRLLTPSPWHLALIRAAATAVHRQPAVGQVIVAALAERGVAFALYRMLAHALPAL